MLLRSEDYSPTMARDLAETLEAARAATDLRMSDHHLSEGQTGTQAITTLPHALGAALKSMLIPGATSSAIPELQRDPHLRIAYKPLGAEALLSVADELITRH
jgi:hypothetical protein